MNEVPLVHLKDVTLRLPVNGVRSLSLRGRIQKTISGGRLSRSLNSTNSDYVDALSSLNLKIYHSERVALLGHNGAGKSTLLKLLGDIYKETTGEVVRNGNIQPMLDKSFWVDEEVSGYHAAKAHYLLHNYNLHGFKSYFESLVEFTDLGQFLDMPIRCYSEGMKTRLLFGLLTSFKFTALALDEAIGTGDNRFIERAKLRLDSFLGSIGTLVIASHSEQLLRAFCTRGIVMDKGRVVFDGPLEESLDFHNSFLKCSQ